MRYFCSTLALAVVLAGSTARAQVPITMSASGRGSPGGSVAATLLPGAKVVPGEKRNGEVFVILEGWIDEKKLGGARDSFPESVGGKLAMRVHTTASKNGKIIAELHAGAGVTVIARSQGWAKVRRGLWVPAKALGALPTAEEAGKESAKSKAAPAKTAKPTPPPQKPAAAKASAPPPKTAPIPAPKSSAAPEKAAAIVPSPAESPAPPPPGALIASRGTAVQTSPSSAAIATLSSGAIVEPLARDRGWVKVRLEGWVNERDLAPTDSAFSAQLTAADLRADPDAHKGKIVRWEVQLLSLQYADVLRRDLARDEPYFLARGPGVENALLYLAVPPSMLRDAKTMPPLTNVIITARVRTGRSDPSGTPILDLRSLAKR